MFLQIHILDNAKFQLEGCNLKQDLYITPWEAALGERIKVNGMEEEVTVYIPAGMQSGEKIKIPQKGYKNNNGGRGDLILEVKIMVPKQMTEKERKMFEKLKEISKFNPRNS